VGHVSKDTRLYHLLLLWDCTILRHKPDVSILNSTCSGAVVDHVFVLIKLVHFLMNWRRSPIVIGNNSWLRSGVPSLILVLMGFKLITVKLMSRARTIQVVLPMRKTRILHMGCFWWKLRRQMRHCVLNVCQLVHQPLRNLLRLIIRISADEVLWTVRISPTYYSRILYRRLLLLIWCLRPEITINFSVLHSW